MVVFSRWSRSTPHFPIVSDSGLPFKWGASVSRWLVACSLTPQIKRSWGSSWTCIQSSSPVSTRSLSLLQTRYGGEAWALEPLLTLAANDACQNTLLSCRIVWAVLAWHWGFNGEVKQAVYCTRKIMFVNWEDFQASHSLWLITSNRGLVFKAKLKKKKKKKT